MKITKSQLKQIIKEELDEIRASGLGTFGPEFPEWDIGPGGETELQDAIIELSTMIVKLRGLHANLPEDRRVEFQKKMLENILVLNSQLDAERAEKEHRNVSFSFGEEALEEEIEERKLTKKEKTDREKLAKHYKPAMKSFKKQYGDEEGESIYYATMTKKAKKGEKPKKKKGK
jgi:hypothetical protein